MSNDPWRNARVMYEKDTCARKMGIELIEMDDGFAQMSMTVSADMLNGHQTCHGGQLFTLADTAFAYACNSQGLAAGAATAGEPATPLWRGALSPQFPAAPEGADGEAP